MQSLPLQNEIILHSTKNSKHLYHFPMLQNLSRLALPVLFVAALGTVSCSKSEDAELEAPAQTSTAANVTELKQFISRTTGTSLDKIVFSAADNSFVID